MAKGNRLFAQASFEPSQGDEVPLSLSDTVIILHEYQDGWVLVRNERKGVIGLVPRKLLGETAASKLEIPSDGLPKRTSSVMPKKQAADDFAQNDQGLTDDQTEAFTPEQRTSYTRFVEVKKSRQARRRTAANVGSLRISICGDSGIGKTSLLSELMRFSEIASRPKMEDPDETVSIDELKCSTISPAELQNGEDPWNLVFIDTPGHGSQLDAMAAIRPILKYHEDQFKRTTGIFTQGLSQPNIVRFVSSGSGGHTHVDACLYCILHRLTPVDIEFMKRLSAFVNVVPVIVKSDSITRDQVFALKVNILLALINNDIPIYGFGLTAEELLALARAKVPGSAPFATYSSEFTSTFGRERNVAPLNDIADLFDVLIYSHTDDLRQLAGEKFVQWRKT